MLLPILGIWLLCGFIGAFLMLRYGFNDEDITLAHLTIAILAFATGIAGLFAAILISLLEIGDKVTIYRRK